MAATQIGVEFETGMAKTILRYESVANRIPYRRTAGAGGCKKSKDQAFLGWVAAWAGRED